MIQESLFNIPCWKIQIINFEEKKKKLTKLLESYPEEKDPTRKLQAFTTNRQSDRSGLAEQFTSIMSEEMEDISKEIKTDFVIPQIWSVSYDKGAYHLPHNHGSTGLTGILYLNQPKDSPDTTYIQPWNDYELDTVQYMEIPITEGDIAIVPSSILHFSKPNESDSKKRIISWDMKILSIYQVLVDQDRTKNSTLLLPSVEG